MSNSINFLPPSAQEGAMQLDFVVGKQVPWFGIQHHYGQGFCVVQKRHEIVQDTRDKSRHGFLHWDEA